MVLTARALNRATLARQLLLRRERLDVAEGIRRVVALQAQEPASPYLALWNRLDGFDPAALDAAFADQRVLKATLMRITLHAVAAEDYPHLRAAMAATLRASRLHDARFRRTGWSIADADALVPELLAHVATPRSNQELAAWTAVRTGGMPEPGVWWALRTSAPLVHAPSGTPWAFGPRPVYVAAPRDAHEDPEASAAHLVRRYLAAFGPATGRDVARYTLLRQPVVRAALDRLGDELEHRTGPDGRPLFDVPGAPLPDEDTDAPPRLLGMWDSVLLAYDDRRRVVPDAYRKVVTRSNGDVLPVVLVDGYARGVWRPTEAGIEATAFEHIDAATWDALGAEAAALRALLAERDPLVYRRYDRWWASLPAAEVRTLG